MNASNVIYIQTKFASKRPETIFALVLTMALLEGLISTRYWPSVNLQEVV